MRGRPPQLDVPRREYLRVRLATFEVERLDRQAGTASRSDFVRDLIEKDARERGIS